MELSFNDLPSVVSKIYMKLESLESILKQKDNQKEPTDELFTIKECAAYLSLSVHTIYGLVHRQAIPCMKQSKRLYFSKTQLNAWLISGKKSTTQEVDGEVDVFLSARATS